METFWNGFTKQASEEERFRDRYNDAYYDTNPATFAAFMSRPENQKKLRKYYANQERVSQKYLSREPHGSIPMGAVKGGVFGLIPGALIGRVYGSSWKAALIGAGLGGALGAGIGASVIHDENTSIDKAKAFMKMPTKKREAYLREHGDDMVHLDLKKAFNELANRRDHE